MQREAEIFSDVAERSGVLVRHEQQTPLGADLNGVHGMKAPHERKAQANLVAATRLRVS